MNKINQDNKKQYSRIVAKISANHPLIILTDINERLKNPANDNLVPIFINCFSYSTALTLDLFGFVSLQYLADCIERGKEKALRLDQGRPTIFVSCMAEIISHFYKRYFNVDYLPLFIYLTESFNSKKNFYLLIGGGKKTPP